MRTESDQRAGLLRITDGGGFGLLMIVVSPGDVVYAMSPVPELVGYEFVFAGKERLYDIWKDDKIVHSEMSLTEVRLFIRKRTPEWLYDDSEPTEEQGVLLRAWVEAAAKRFKR